jgi:hypothetical protein
MTGRLLLAAGLVVTTALAMAWGSGSPAQATTFNPFFGITSNSINFTPGLSSTHPVGAPLA